MFTKLHRLYRKTESPQSRTLAISEPVLSFVKCVKDNPKRFKVRTTKEYNEWLYNTYNTVGSLIVIPRPRFYLLDTITKEQFVFDISLYKYISGENRTQSHYLSYYPNYLTEDESVFIMEELFPIFSERQAKSDAIHKIRKDRERTKVVKTARDRLSEIYCNQ